MILLAALLGTALPALTGWLLLRAIEWRTPVLLWAERWALGFLLGLTLTTFLVFLGNVTGLLGVTLASYMIVQALVALPCAALLSWKVPGFWKMRSVGTLAPSPMLKRWQWGLLLGLGAWTALKLLAGTFMLLTEPPYLDDTATNWNLRGKVFFVDRAFTLTLPSDKPGTVGGISSYSPSVPLAKAWYATLAGQWQEGLINLVHVLWLLALLVCLYALLRRSLPVLWSWLGVYLLLSLPLFLLHGTQPYADVFLAAHLFAAVGLLFQARRAQTEAMRSSFLRLSALAAGLLAFTKSEGLVLYLPVYLVVVAFLFWSLHRERRLTAQDLRRSSLWILLCIAAVALPWLAFKWLHGLPFGNAKAVTGLSIGWQPGVVTAIVFNTFLEGNWLLFFPLFLILLFVRRTVALRPPLSLLLGFVALAYFVQFPLFLFTSLSVEAILQTGYARGVIHLMPLACALATLLVADLAQKRE